MDLLLLLKEELVPALGCTEPIAIAYAAARARDLLSEFPEKIIVECSGNVIKNVKGVVIPGTENMKGIETCAVLGAIVGNSSNKLEVLKNVSKDNILELSKCLKQGMCEVKLVEGVDNLYIRIQAYKGENTASVKIINGHTNIVEEILNGDVLYCEDVDHKICSSPSCCITFCDILSFIKSVEIGLLKEILENQVIYNMNIAEEGLNGDFGASVGKTLIEIFGDSPNNMAKAYAAAGSDARMNGCTLPVVINSGSGNQGLTVSLPVIIYAKHLNVTEDKLYRALALSNLVAIMIKKGTGKLSAYCGAVSAASGSGAGIAFLHDESVEVIENTIVNTLANTSGIICDGAKASCAAKIATSVDAAILAYEMAKKGRAFSRYEGILARNFDDIIANVVRVAKDGMKSTDLEILNIMIGK